MAILKQIISPLAAILLTGCYENFNPEFDTTPVLCLNSLIKAGEPITVEVSHSWVFNDEKSENNHEVTDAVVTVYANGSIVGGDYIPKEGDELRIVAESPVYGAATAEVSVPYATPIGAVRFRPTVTGLWSGDEDFFHYAMLADITFSLNVEMDVCDPAGTDNYYQLGYSEYRSPSEECPDDGELDASTPYVSLLSLGKFEYDSEPIFKEHVGVLETVMGNSEDMNFMFFTDRQFPGRTYTLHLNFTDNVFRVKSQEYDESLFDCEMYLELVSVSKSYYNWAVYKWNVDEGVIGDLSDIGLAEPKWGYSNVSTGAGVVAAQSSTVVSISLRDFLKSAFDNRDK